MTPEGEVFSDDAVSVCMLLASWLASSFVMSVITTAVVSCDTFDLVVSEVDVLRSIRPINSFILLYDTAPSIEIL